MTAHLELIQRGLAVVAALLYVFLGYKTGMRRVASEARGALRAWQLWWYGLAAITILGAAVSPLVQAQRSVPLTLAYTVPVVVVLTGVVSSLLYYLLYLYTGKRAVLRGVLVYFVALSVFFSFLVSGALSPEGYPRYAEDPETGAAEFQSGPPDGTYGRIAFVSLLALVVPLLASAVAYGMLYVRLEGRTERYRIAMVGGGLVFWFGTSFLSSIAGQALHGLPDWWPIVSRLVALAAAVVILLAYYPPGSWQRRYGLRSLNQETEPPSSPQAPPGP